jgi:hypothetical protein
MVDFATQKTEGSDQMRMTPDKDKTPLGRLKLAIAAMESVRDDLENCWIDGEPTHATFFVSIAR